MQQHPGLPILDANAALLHCNADNVKDRMIAMIDETAAPIRRIIPDLTFSTETALSTARMPMDTARRIHDAGIDLRRTGAYRRVRALLGNVSRSCAINDRSMAPFGRKGNGCGKT